MGVFEHILINFFTFCFFKVESSIAQLVSALTRNRKVAGSMREPSMLLCPWERHFTRISPVFEW